MMNTNRNLVLSLALLVCVALLLSSAWVKAAPPVPATFYGTVKVNGANPPVYVSVEAVIGGQSYAAVPVQSSGPDVVYAIHVPGDMAETAAIKEGGAEGETVQFRVGGLLCSQSGTWNTGVPTNLDLTATGTLPTITATPTGEPSETPTPTFTATRTPSVTSTPQVKDLRPSNTTIKDTYISSWHTDDPRGLSDPTRIRVRSGAFRGLIYFDLSLHMSPSAQVRNATLYLYLSNYEHLMHQAPQVAVYKCKQGWTDTEATWHDRKTDVRWGSNGGDGLDDREMTASATTTVSDVSAWYEWDITDLVQEWVTNPAENQGMFLISDNSRELRFYSVNDSDTRYQPYLRVDFIEGVNPVSTATTTPTPSRTPSGEPTEDHLEIRGASKDTYIYEWGPDTNYEAKGLNVQGYGWIRSLLDFGVSEIPEGAQIISATLQLTSAPPGDGKTWALNVGAYELHRSWVADQATWNIASTGNPWSTAGAGGIPGDREGSPASVTVVQEVSGGTPGTMIVYEWDVRAIVQSWVDDPAEQAGLMLMATNENSRKMGFYDSHRPEQEKEYKPLLVIDWRVGPIATETYTPTPTPTSTATATPTDVPTISTTPTTDTTVTPTATVEPGDIEGVVFHDQDLDGIKDGDELGLGGVTVQIWQNEVMLAFDVTDGSGAFEFLSLAPGVYLVKEIDPPGYVSSPASPNERNALVTSGGTTEVNFGDCLAGQSELLHIPLVYK